MFKLAVLFAILVASHAQVLRISPAVVGVAKPGPQQVIYLVGGGSAGSGGGARAGGAFGASSAGRAGASFGASSAGRAGSAFGASSAGRGSAAFGSGSAGRVSGGGAANSFRSQSSSFESSSSRQGGLNLAAGQPTVILAIDGGAGLGGFQSGSSYESSSSYNSNAGSSSLGGASLQASQASALSGGSRRASAASASRLSAREEEAPVGKPEPFSFQFDSEDELGTKISRQESSDDSGTVVGSYSLSDVSGISRIVNYIADADGFRAQVQTNEPGTLSSSPADVQVQSSAPAAPARA